MRKLQVEDLERISERVRKMTLLREGAGRAKITVHMGTCGIAAGARKIMNTLLDAFEQQKIQDVLLTSSGCAGLCSQEPMVTVEIEGEAPVKYVELTPEKALHILKQHVEGGDIVEEYALGRGSERLS